MSLANWEERLREHFGELRRQRTIARGDKPIFALEHGLRPDEVTQLVAAVRASVARVEPDWSDPDQVTAFLAHQVPHKDAPLTWVAYAAELGYQYSGDEYWQTFEEHTPGWRQYGDRQRLRTCYRKFQKEFGAAEPKGPWAEHFSIICWPITHAILPRDLQRQLAQILYDHRYSLSADLFDAPERLGEFIRTRSFGASSRFQQLVEDPPLVGQIAAALLLQGKFGTSGLIDGLTLRRIGEDLDAERRSREWLRRARGVAEERARVRGFGPTGGQQPSGLPDIGRAPIERARAEVSSLGIEPRLLLRPKANGHQWDVVLEVPDLTHLLNRYPETRDVLAASRCTVAGSTGRPLARGRCLHGVQHVRLTSWPAVGDVLLQFEAKNPVLEYLLRTECLLRPGPLWLFRIASDGLAYELLGQRIRPGHSYIAIRLGAPLVGPPLEAIDLACTNVSAALLRVPPTVDRNCEDTLKRLGLDLAKTIEAWPAGLDALAWDGEGHGEWFVSERPCLAIRVDHSVDGLFAVLDDHRITLDLPTADPDAPIFVELPQLAAGHHTMRLSARARSSEAAEPIGDLEIVMRVRETPAPLGVSSHGPLTVEVEPPNPGLEQFWEGHVDVSIRGPEGRLLKCFVTLSDKGTGGLPRQIHSIGLPVTPARWRDHFDRHVRRAEWSRAYDTADTCLIRFDGEELGAFEIACERDFRPLRWIVRRSGQRYSARIIDDSGAPEPLQVVRLAFETPTAEDVVDGGPLYDVPLAGGLYVARRDDDSAAVIISPHLQGDFRALRCVPRLPPRGKSVSDVLFLMRIARDWARARTPGNTFALGWRRDVLRALTRDIFRILGGDSWARTEAEADRTTDGLDELKRAVSKKPDERGVASGLLLALEDLDEKSCEQRVTRLAQTIETFRLLPRGSGTVVHAAGGAVIRKLPPADRSHWIAELALRLASTPWDVEPWAGEALTDGVTRLQGVPTIAKAARFLVLAIDRRMSMRATQQEAFSTWRWE